MTIDLSAGVPAPHFFDVKLDKKTETEGTEPVEASEESEDAKLDMARQDIAKKRTTKELADEAHAPVGIYNAKGKIKPKLSF